MNKSSLLAAITLLVTSLIWPSSFASDPWPRGPGTEIGQVGQPGGLPFSDTLPFVTKMTWEVDTA